MDECYVCGEQFYECETERHHVQYKPEVTVIVCKECHESIHHVDGFMDHLKPGHESLWDEEQEQLDEYRGT